MSAPARAADWDAEAEYAYLGARYHTWLPWQDLPERQRRRWRRVVRDAYRAGLRHPRRRGLAFHLRAAIRRRFGR